MSFRAAHSALRDKMMGAFSSISIKRSPVPSEGHASQWDITEGYYGRNAPL